MAVVQRLPSRELMLDLALWLVIAAPVFGFDELPDARQVAVVPLEWTQVAAVPLFGVAALASRRYPTVAATVPPALGLAATPEMLTNNYLVAQVVLAYLLGRRAAGQAVALLLFIAACAAGLLVILVTPATVMTSGTSLVFLALTTLVLPWLVGRYVRQQAELVRTGWELAERLEREHELTGEQARLRERSRIARDMHDSLGHELSMIALRAAALQVAPDVGKQGRHAAAELRRAAAEATSRLREVIGVLREDHETAPMLPAGDTVRSLVDRATASGVAVTLVDELTPAGDDEGTALPPMTHRAAYRVVQEALTNATKHAPGAPVTVTLRRQGAEAVVTVVNRATASRRRPGAPGHGLAGLDERVRLAGGTLDAWPAVDGFTVTARLPLTLGAVTTPGAARTSRHQLALARRRLRRSMINAMWAPAVTIAALLLLWFGFNLFGL
ncbi:sensor histidine kinase [Dactylosporangium roseum]|uniref:histidine kinase n=1 Tax=Dactylosporangium roseum TaxID=47989 RepID=A0ABY5ZG13_9ACTN|nr:histidine kinase [Dactylosporangium roseum]UWZ39687.1 sensor histidine kinase [Dactylosporangium roseum]